MSYIGLLFAAFLAGDAVYKIVAVAAHFVHCSMHLLCCGCLYLPRPVYTVAVPTGAVVTLGAFKVFISGRSRVFRLKSLALISRSLRFFGLL